MKALWTEPEASVTGRFWQLDAAPMEPKPFQKPYPPLWFGGSHPAALRRATRHGDGFFGAGDALDYDVLRQAPDAFDVNVTGCRYAQFYKELGVPELGFLLVCSNDFDAVEGYGDVQLTRTQTIMQGAPHCATGGSR